MKPSPLFTINLRDFAHGLIISAGTAAFSIVEGSVSAGSLQIDWQRVALAALAGGLAYIGKKFFQNPNPINNATLK